MAPSPLVPEEAQRFIFHSYEHADNRNATRPADDEGDSPMDLEDQPEQRWQDVLPQIQHTFEDAKPWWCAGNLECRE